MIGIISVFEILISTLSFFLKDDIDYYHNNTCGYDTVFLVLRMLSLLYFIFRIYLLRFYLR